MTPPTRGTLRTAGRVLALVLGLAFAASALYVATIAGDGLMWLGAALIALLALDLLVAAVRARHPVITAWLGPLP